MFSPDQKLSKKSPDIRLKATSIIWSFATGMFAICIPLSSVTNSGAVLPITVFVGTTLATASVWRKSQDESANSFQTEERIKQLEGRIADLETIIASEEMNWRLSIEPNSKSELPYKSLPTTENKD